MKNLFFRFADLVSICDELLVQQNYKLVPAKVTNVSSIITEGKHWYFVIIYLPTLRSNASLKTTVQILTIDQ